MFVFGLPNVLINNDILHIYCGLSEKYKTHYVYKRFIKTYWLQHIKYVHILQKVFDSY